MFVKAVVGTVGREEVHGGVANAEKPDIMQEPARWIRKT